MRKSLLHLCKNSNSNPPVSKSAPPTLYKTVKSFTETVKDTLSLKDDGRVYGAATGVMPSNDWATWIERTWKCPCGHTFRASGIWTPTEPTMCEAPGCPNPKFFLAPGNQHLLGGNKGAIRMPSSPDTKALPPKK